ncbi:MAG: inner membrane CreD family protein, partial [Bacteroidetes bacterium]|nr:inner membrane CreD family protein [Candidatus Cryptobacteroides intestinigallinarum]
MKLDENKKLMLKGAVVVLTALFMMIPVLMVRNVVAEREELSEQVAREITRSWGGEQTLSPPSLKVMYDENSSEGYVGYRVCSSASDEADISGE